MFEACGGLDIPPQQKNHKRSNGLLAIPRSTGTDLSCTTDATAVPAARQRGQNKGPIPGRRITPRVRPLAYPPTQNKAGTAISKSFKASFSYHGADRGHTS